MFNILRKTICYLFFTLTLVGCGTTKAPSTQIPDDAATTKLAEAASSISQSLTDLNAIEKASRPPVNDKVLAYPTGADMDQTASIDWAGPIEPLLTRIADNCDYKLRVIGARPAVPVLVTISAQNTPIGYIIRDANFQAGSRASVLVYPAIKVIELRYAKA